MSYELPQMLKKLLQVVQENHKEEESQDQPQDQGFLHNPVPSVHSIPHQVKGSDPGYNPEHQQQAHFVFYSFKATWLGFGFEGLVQQAE